MKKIAMLLLSCLFVFNVVVNAQNNDKRERKGGSAESRQSLTPEQRVDGLAKDLILTDAEKVKVLELFKKQDADMTKFKSENSRGDADFRTKYKEFRNSQDDELKTIIGTENFQKLQTLQDERKEKMQNGGGRNR